MTESMITPYILATSVKCYVLCIVSLWIIIMLWSASSPEPHRHATNSRELSY